MTLYESGKNPSELSRAHVATELAKLFGEVLILFVGIIFLIAPLQVYVSPARVKSLPELTLLGSMFQKKMIAAFVTCVFVVAIVTGCARNFVL